MIVTNPTHYCGGAEVRRRQDARAARGRQGRAPAGAEDPRNRVQQHHVPLLEAPPLARALYHHAELGDEIPQALYNAVAEVLAYVYQLRRHREYGGNGPQGCRTPSRCLPELDPE